MIFTPNEAYQVYIIQTLIKNFHIIWIELSDKQGKYSVIMKETRSQNPIGGFSAYIYEN